MRRGVAALAARYRGGRERRRFETTVTELPDSRVRLQVQVPPERGRGASGAQGAPARTRAEAPRLPPGQGARAARDPARRPRGGARGGRPRHALRLVRGGGRAGRHRPGRRSRRSSSASCLPTVQPLEFSIELGVLPKAELGAYEGLEVGRREPAARSSRSSGRSRRCASAWRAWRPPSARPPRATSS